MASLNEIIPDQESRDNFRVLCDFYKQQKSIIIFYGAGIGKNPGLPTWKELLVSLSKEIGLEYKKLSGEYWNKASTIEDEFILKNKDFYDAIRKYLIPTDSHLSGVLECLLNNKRFNSFITTNFDNILYRLIRKKKLNIHEQFYPIFNPSRLTHNETIYLHGNVFHSNDIVFTKGQYEKAYTSNYENLIDIINHAYWYNSIVFLGFSFEDNFFNNLYLKAQKDRRKYLGGMRQKAPSDFVLLDAPYINDNEVDFISLENKKNWFKSTFGIKPISFCLNRGGFICLEDLMEILTGEVTPEGNIL